MNDETYDREARGQYDGPEVEYPDRMPPVTYNELRTGNPTNVRIYNVPAVDELGRLADDGCPNVLED